MPSTPDGVIAAHWVARAKKGKEAELRDHIARVVTPSRNDPGNIDYEVHEDEARPGTFLVYERWTSREALQAHTESSWIPKLIPPLQALIEGDIEDELRILRPIRPAQ
ncbi:putative quinol monooxygenase [Streptomyces aurantiacus]|uniref:Antibiotic biosynthesis monooxygenase n=1 Tax=Streptomyces aurantiacus TaxID=47760 RepID=A0A7G1P5C5_9ACTN|nr:putative quinol monooxygenase [Streptomyces aurantiacus]BCL31023.1 antibiotic biosynthesis monooxygenase [Streptomyces aurantiacus]